MNLFCIDSKTYAQNNGLLDCKWDDVLLSVGSSCQSCAGFVVSSLLFEAYVMCYSWLMRVESWQEKPVEQKAQGKESW